MKSAALVILVSMMVWGCKTISYENARSSNKDKFYGDKETSALLLVDLKNYSQLAEDLSGLTADRCYAREVYLFGRELTADHNRFQRGMKLNALFRGIRLPNSVSSDEQEHYQRILQIDDPMTFDRKYLTAMDRVLDSMLVISERYLDISSDEKISQFLEKQTGVFRAEMEKVREMYEYIREQDPGMVPELTSNK